MKQGNLDVYVVNMDENIGYFGGANGAGIGPLVLASATGAPIAALSVIAA